MAFKYLILASVLAYASAGFLPAAPAVAYSSAPAVSSSYFNQASAPVAHAAYAAPVAHATYAAPVAHATYAAPVAHATYAAPVAHATYAAPIAHATYAAPITHATYAAPAVAHATYGAPAVAVHAPSVGVSQQSVARSLGGAQSVSHYSKAVDSAFSSVRKYDTRFTNDALVAKAVAPVAYAAPVAYGAPVAHAPVVAKAAVAYSPAAVVAHTNFQGLGIEYHY